MFAVTHAVGVPTVAAHSLIWGYYYRNLLKAQFYNEHLAFNVCMGISSGYKGHSAVLEEQKTLRAATLRHFSHRSFVHLFGFASSAWPCLVMLLNVNYPALLFIPNKPFLLLLESKCRLSLLWSLRAELTDINISVYTCSLHHASHELSSSQAYLVSSTNVHTPLWLDCYFLPLPPLVHDEVVNFVLLHSWVGGENKSVSRLLIPCTSEDLQVKDRWRVYAVSNLYPRHRET